MPADIKSGLKSIVVNGLVLSLAKLAGSGCRIIYAFSLAYFLGAELYGEFNYALSWYISLIPLTVFGTDWLILRASAIDQSATARLIRTTLFLRIVLGVLVVACSYIAALALESDEGMQKVLGIISLSIIARAVALWSTSVLTAQEQTGCVFLLEVFFRFSELFLAIWLLTSDGTVLQLALLHTSIWSFQATAGFFIVRSLQGSERHRAGWTPLKKILLAGLPYLVGGVSLGWMFQAPLILRRLESGSGDVVGSLALCLQILVVITALSSEFASAAVGVISRRMSSSIDKLSEVYTRIILFLGMAIGLAVWIASLAIEPLLTSMLLEHQFDALPGMLPLVGLAMIPAFWITSLSSVIIAHERYTCAMIGNVAGAVLLHILCVYWIPPGEPASSILAMLIALTLASIGTLASIRSISKQVVSTRLAGLEP